MTTAVRLTCPACGRFLAVVDPQPSYFEAASCQYCGLNIKVSWKQGPPEKIREKLAKRRIP